jgi:CBS domain-containing protein
MTMRQALLYAETVGQRAYPVVGEKETEMLGLITLYDLNLAMAANRPDTTPIRELMDPEPQVSTPDDHLDRAVDLLDQTDSNILPVIASKVDRRLIGVLSHATIIRAYNEYQTERE